MPNTYTGKFPDCSCCQGRGELPCSACDRGSADCDRCNGTDREVCPECDARDVPTDPLPVCHCDDPMHYHCSELRKWWEEAKRERDEARKERDKYRAKYMIANEAADLAERERDDAHTELDGRASRGLADKPVPLTSRIRAALQMAREEGWLEGRDAAAEELTRLLRDKQATAVWVGADELRRLVPPWRKMEEP